MHIYLYTAVVCRLNNYNSVNLLLIITDECRLDCVKFGLLSSIVRHSSCHDSSSAQDQQLRAHLERDPLLDCVRQPLLRRKWNSENAH